jgi:hypothetical protein
MPKETFHRMGSRGQYFQVLIAWYASLRADSSSPQQDIYPTLIYGLRKKLACLFLASVSSLV